MVVKEINMEKLEGYEPVTERTKEEFIAQLEEHDRQQRRQLFFRQLGSISPLNRYQPVRYRCLQRSSLGAMAVWLLGHKQPMMAEPKGLTGRELAM